MAGFLIVFVAMSLFITTFSMHPSGEHVVACKLWQYYLLEMKLALSDSEFLGPRTGSTTAAVSTAFQHVLLSTVGGAVMMGIGWAVHKVRSGKGS
jgi:hypothetical protein